MHMAQVIAGGLLLLGTFLLFGKLWSAGAAEAFVVAATVFLPVWLAVAVANMWVGVTKAGYTAAQELPILLVVFAVPAVVALVVAWRFARG
jgi:hypothetical protein